MNRHTRKMLLNIATGVAVAATAAVVFLPAAYAAPGTVTSNVNLRSGPGTSYGVIGTVARGSQVDVQQCQGSWCYIVKSGPDGWISANYLSAGGAPVNPSQPGISFGFNLGGPNGPQISIGVGNQPQPPVVIQPVPPQEFLDAQQRVATKRVEVVSAAAAAQGLACRAHTVEALHAWEAIIDHAKNEEVDLIVMASHGRRGVAALLLGSETQKVLTHTDLPVLIVK